MPKGHSSLEDSIKSFLDEEKVHSIDMTQYFLFKNKRRPGKKLTEELDKRSKFLGLSGRPSLFEKRSQKASLNSNHKMSPVHKKHSLMLLKRMEKLTKSKDEESKGDLDFIYSDAFLKLNLSRALSQCEGCDTAQVPSFHNPSSLGDDDLGLDADLLGEFGPSYINNTNNID